MNDASATPEADDRDDTAFLREARERFTQGQDADRDNRTAALEDLRFLAGDQWDSATRAARLRQGRPCLTVNRLPQFVGQVIGDLRINQPAIRVRPARDATKETAAVREGLIRAIEYASDAQGAYVLAGEDQVSCGIGHFRVALEYSTDDAFDRDIRIRHIVNPLGPVWDPMSVEPTGEDAKWCFVPDEMDRKEFEKRYPKATPEGLASDLMGELTAQSWISRDVVRVTEYWTVVERPQTFALMQDGRTQEVTKDTHEKLRPFMALGPDGKPRTRDSRKRSVRMWLITGHAVLEGPFDLPITRLPIMRVRGREVREGTKRHRFGLVRFAKDGQRYLNYFRSAAAEVIALAPKANWLLNEQQEGDGDAFRQAHRSGDTVLPYSGPQPPVRVNPPPVPQALMEQAGVAAQDLKDVTGLHDASLGAQSNETSGKAIMARERQGDVATFMYLDDLHKAIAAGGRVINELIPAIYDTARVVSIVGEDGSAKPQPINDPNDPKSVQVVQPKDPADPAGPSVAVGRFDIVVESGPSYSTKRVEAAESMMQFIQAFPQAAPLIGDLVAKAQDWPLSDKIGDRLQAMLPPQVQQEEDEHDGKPPKPAPPPDPIEVAMKQLAVAKAEGENHEIMARVDKIRAEIEEIQARAFKAVADGERGLFEVGQLHGQVEALATGNAAGILVDADAQKAAQEQQAQAQGQAMDAHGALLAQDQQAHQRGGGVRRFEALTKRLLAVSKSDLNRHRQGEKDREGQRRTDGS